MNVSLTVKVTTTGDGRPLIEVANFPGLFVEFRHEQLRALARQLIDIANDACHGFEGKRTYPAQEQA